MLYHQNKELNISSDYPQVAIIILNWNGWQDTIECLESVYLISYPNYKVLVVDNGSQDDSIKVIQEWIEVKSRDEKKREINITLIQNEINLGFAEGNNVGIKYALGNYDPDYILLLNNDTVVDSEFLNELIKVAEEDMSIGILGPKTYLYNDPNRLQLVWIDVDLIKGRGRHIGSLQVDNGQYDFVNKDCDAVQGSCILIKKKLIEKVGFLDIMYYCYWEETDFCFRAKKIGYKIAYIAKAKIWHKVSASTKKNKYIHDYWIIRNTFYFMKLHSSKYQQFFFFFYYFIFRLWFISSIALLYHRNLIEFKGIFKGTIDGLKVYWR